MNNGGLTMKNVVLIKKKQPMNTGCGMMWALKMVCWVYFQEGYGKPPGFWFFVIN